MAYTIVQVSHIATQRWKGLALSSYIYGRMACLHRGVLWSYLPCMYLSEIGGLLHVRNKRSCINDKKRNAQSRRCLIRACYSPLVGGQLYRGGAGGKFVPILGPKFSLKISVPRTGYFGKIGPSKNSLCMVDTQSVRRSVRLARI